MKHQDGDKRLITLAVITTAHGIRGEVKLRSFTSDPYDITSYGPLIDKAGRQYTLTITGSTKDALIARIEGVTTREAAEILRNTELLVARSALPETKANEYYHEDLVGLKLNTQSGDFYGTIAGVHNFGAGDLIVIKGPSGDEEFLPFNRETFVSFDIDKSTGVIIPPEVVPDE